MVSRAAMPLVILRPSTGSFQWGEHILEDARAVRRLRLLGGVAELTSPEVFAESLSR
jgi:hypothetical protein